jgi:hypothetical protein
MAAPAVFAAVFTMSIAEIGCSILSLKRIRKRPDKFDPREYLKPAREAMKEMCRARMVSFCQAGNAGKPMTSSRVK